MPEMLLKPSGGVADKLISAVSGGMHLDGLSDTADGFLSARPRARILEIMKDSHVGVMGAAAIASLLLLKASAVASIPREMLWRVAFLMPVAGRSALVVSMAVLPYARPEGGVASVFYKRRLRSAALLAAALLATAGWLACRWSGLVCAGASVGAVLLFSAWAYRRIGGATGDTLGAACEIAEVVPALVLSAWCFRG